MNRSQHNLDQVLLEVVQSLTAELDLPVVLSTILDQLARLVDYDSASIMLLDGEVLNPTVRRSVFSIHERSLTLHVAAVPHVYEAISQQRPVLINDTQSDSRWLRRTENERIRSWLGVPLIVSGHVIGLLNISHAEPGHFDSDSVRVANAFAAFAAVALNNAALFHRLQDELAKRANAETELQQERTLLAERVAEQTAALRLVNQEIARTSRMKDEFLAAMSHELRTPLNVIINMTDLLREQVFGEVTPGQQQALERVNKHSKHLLSLISDVLDVARIESGRLGLLAHDVDIDALCRACLLQINTEDKNLAVTYTIDDAQSRVVGDERRLRQILMNLLSNAVKFTGEGGAIGLEAAHDAEHDCLALTVWDTGIGIDATDLHRLFQPFVQLDSSLSRRYEGTGLGLTLVHRLTELHGGSLAIESSKGGGSRFTVRIPWVAVQKPEPDKSVPPEDGDSVAPLVLLLSGLEHADDLLAAALQCANCRVESLLQGIDLQLDEVPDLVILVGHPPLRNIIQTLEMLRSNKVLTNTPIIVLTTLHLSGYSEAILTAGASAYAIKPLGKQAFDRMIQTYVARTIA